MMIHEDFSQYPPDTLQCPEAPEALLFRLQDTRLWIGNQNQDPDAGSRVRTWTPVFWMTLSSGAYDLLISGRDQGETISFHIICVFPKRQNNSGWQSK